MSFLHRHRASLDELEDEKREKAENVEDFSNITCVDDIQVLGLAPEDAEFYRNFDTKKKKRVLWKAWSHHSPIGKLTNSKCLAGRCSTSSDAFRALFGFTPR
jgi:hypothetical protein